MINIDNKCAKYVALEDLYVLANGKHINIPSGETVYLIGQNNENNQYLLSYNNGDGCFFVSESRIADILEKLDVIKEDNVKTPFDDLTSYILNNYNPHGNGTIVSLDSEKNFGSRVIKLRDEKGWSQEDLANKAGLTIETIIDIESENIKDYDRRSVFAILLAMKLPYDEFTNYLASAGMIFNRSSIEELIIKKNVENGDFTFDAINKDLESFGIKPF